MSSEIEKMKQFSNEREFIEWNELMAHKYDPDAYHTRSNFVIRWIEKRRVNVIKKYTSTDHLGNIIEVGCGAGNILEELSGRSLYGIDLSKYLLHKSKKRLHQKGVSLIQANAERMPFSNKRFHGLVCTEVLEHVQKPRDVLLEMVRIAADNAIFVISFPNESLINSFKRLIRILRLEKLLLQSEKEGDYSSPMQMMDEWHLYEFDLSTFVNLSKGIFVITHMTAVPFRIVPLRYVVRCQSLQSYM